MYGQGQEDDALQWADQIHAQAVKCNFREGFDEILRDRFYSGLLPRLLAKYFELNNGNLSFVEAIQIALIEEAAYEAKKEKKNKNKK